MRIVLSAAIALLVSSSAALAQSKSITGTWNAAVTTPTGTGAPTLTFAVKGDSVSGTVKRPTGESFPLKGTIKGKDLTYTYTIMAGGAEQTLVSVIVVTRVIGAPV